MISYIDEKFNFKNKFLISKKDLLKYQLYKYFIYSSIIADLIIKICVLFGIIGLIPYLEYKCSVRIDRYIFYIILIFIAKSFGKSIQYDFDMLKKPSISEIVYQINPYIEDEHMIIQDIREVFHQFNIKIPSNILLSFYPNCKLTYTNIKTTRHTFKDYNLIIGIPLLKYLTHDEFKAILAVNIILAKNRFNLTPYKIANFGSKFEKIYFDENNNNESKMYKDVLVILLLYPITIVLLKLLKNYLNFSSKYTMKLNYNVFHDVAAIYGKNNLKKTLIKSANLFNIFYKNFQKDFSEDLINLSPFENYFHVLDNYVSHENLIDITKLDFEQKEFLHSEFFLNLPNINIVNKENRIINFSNETIEKILTQEAKDCPDLIIKDSEYSQYW